MERLTGVIQPYAWGSLTAIPEFLGAEATGKPQAELWFGAHPLAPSMAGRRAPGQGGGSDPVGVVGGAAVEAFGARLPFLLKVIAAAQPLSLQAHPSRTQAEAGFAREQASGTPRDAQIGATATAGRSQSCCLHCSDGRTVRVPGTGGNVPVV